MGEVIWKWLISNFFIILYYSCYMVAKCQCVPQSSLFIIIIIIILIWLIIIINDTIEFSTCFGPIFWTMCWSNLLEVVYVWFVFFLLPRMVSFWVYVCLCYTMLWPKWMHGLWSQLKKIENFIYVANPCLGFTLLLAHIFPRSFHISNGILLHKWFGC